MNKTVKAAGHWYQRTTEVRTPSMATEISTLTQSICKNLPISSKLPSFRLSAGPEILNYDLFR